MAEYELLFARSARKELEALDEPLRSRVFSRIESLALAPRPSGCKKLQGSQHLWRIRVGDYRVVYGVYDEQGLVDIVAVRHRREAYR